MGDKSHPRRSGITRVITYSRRPLPLGYAISKLPPEQCFAFLRCHCLFILVFSCSKSIIKSPFLIRFGRVRVVGGARCSQQLPQSISRWKRRSPRSASSRNGCLSYSGNIFSAAYLYILMANCRIGLPLCH